MRRLVFSNNISLDGFFTDRNGSMSWAKMDRDEEFQAYVNSKASTEGPLVFGRITYQLMASYWPTPMAMQNDPVVAKGMNRRPKFVFSRSLPKAEWENTTLVKDDAVEEVRRLKAEAGEDIAILGSGSLVSQLVAAGLIDEFQLIVNPVVIGKGRSLFETVTGVIPVELRESQTFKNGKVILSYVPKQ